MRLLRWIACLLGLVATTSLAQTWRQLPGAANDISVGPKGEVWVIGTDRAGNEYGIHRLDGGNWTKVPGSAVRIDVGPAGPWVINSGGGIYRWNGGGWDHIPGGARDIGIGANGEVWVIGGNVEPGGFGIYKWAGGGNWNKVPGSAVRIDVGPDGNPWVVTSGHAIYRYNGSAFVQVPGAASDIGIGANGQVYVVGTDQGVYRWNGSTWVRTTGILSEISVDHQGNPWGVNPGKQVFASSGSPQMPPAPPGPTGGLIPVFPPGTPEADMPRPGEFVPVIYARNTYGDRWVWITTYDLGKTRILDSGCVDPGKIRYWTGGYAYGSYYYLRAEVMTQKGCVGAKTCDTTGQINPNNSSLLGSGKGPSGLWWRVIPNGSNCYIDKGLY